MNISSAHELYERNYAGNHENIRLENILMCDAKGRVEEAKALVEKCMSEYDVDGWTVPDLINSDDVNFFHNSKIA